MSKQTFITNSKKTNTLKKRLVELITHSQELKFLVGFFYFSGWQELYNSLKEQEDLTVKILVGLEVDHILGRTVELVATDQHMSNDEIAEGFFESLGKALNTDEMDVESFYTQVEYFVHLLESNKLIIRKTLEPNHAKLYIFKIKDSLQGIADCKFITGSSNLTRAGISGQNEFNVEIGDYGTEEAETYFDELWETAVPITESHQGKTRLINFIRNNSQAALVTPFEAYMVVLKTYLDLMAQKEIKPQIERLLEKRGYKNFSYQRDAVTQALTIIEQYNGVIIADVVGLGKSVIAGMIAKSLGRRGMVICPPGLMGDKNGGSGWEKYLHDFELYDWEVRSSGDLENTSDYIQGAGSDIEVVVVDEAHRFRNEDTESYELLNTICRNKIVILLTATPFNNSPADIFSLLKLFIVPGKSNVTLDDNLEARFASYEAEFRKLSHIVKNFKSASHSKKTRAETYYLDLFDSLPVDIAKVHQRSRHLASEIRSILEPVLIRRNRIDLRNDPVYSSEITELSDVEDPIEQFFELSEEQSLFYDEVVNTYFGENGQFKGAIYQPFSYEQGLVVEQDLDSDDQALGKEENRAFYQQLNLYDFMRRLLVKRFESSFGAFRKSIDNFIRVHERVLEFIDKSGGRYILDRKLIEKIYDGNSDDIDTALEEFAEKLAKDKRPKNDKIYEVKSFKQSSLFLSHINSDLKLMIAIKNEIDNLNLVKKDPKAAKLLESIRHILTEKSSERTKRKVIIFSEYVDTVRYLRPLFEEVFPGTVLTVEGNITTSLHKQILTNFDASVPSSRQEDAFQILLTSDTLSEGFNLNRAGLIVNYDIPWNPTRVIQRVGRINRIGKKVFDKLMIYNFFPTVQGSDIIKSRQIASQKMFLIHSTLGEDAKIFEPDESPSASEMYTRINQNPEKDEDESLITTIRKKYNEFDKKFPDAIKRLESLPSRIKTAKSYSSSQLTVFQRKGLGLFVQHIPNPNEQKPQPESLLLQEALPLIECSEGEPRLQLSQSFWPCYEIVKEYKSSTRTLKSEISLEIKALNNLQTALRLNNDMLVPYLPFIKILIKDLRDYRTLPKYTLRRISAVSIDPSKQASLDDLIKELSYLRSHLGDDYISIVEDRVGSIKKEIIIAIENIRMS